MTDRTHLKVIGLLWGILALLPDGQIESLSDAVIFGLAGLCYVASFFASREQSS